MIRIPATQLFSSNKLCLDSLSFNYVIHKWVTRTCETWSESVVSLFRRQSIPDMLRGQVSAARFDRLSEAFEVSALHAAPSYKPLSSFAFRLTPCRQVSFSLPEVSDHADMEGLAARKMLWPKTNTHR